MRTCVTCSQSFSGDAVFCPFDGTKLERADTQRVVQPSDADLAPGRCIDGHYRIDRVIGSGGMGVVLAVTHLVLGKRFALKVLKRELASDPDTRARFLLEAQAAGQIHHPNVVEITDYTSLPDGGAYLVMEYLDGTPLSQLLKTEGRLSARRAASLARDVALGLQAAHEAGVIHRDLKPDNIFVMRIAGREVGKVLDFGVAKVAGAARLTRTGMVFGTPHYMSPEQASGGLIDVRTDVYALGVIIYEMMTGRVPFQADTYMEVLTKHMFEAPASWSSLEAASGSEGEEEGRALEAVTLKALEKRPEERHASMLELVGDLERALPRGPSGRWGAGPTARSRDSGSGSGKTAVTMLSASAAPLGVGRASLPPDGADDAASNPALTRARRIRAAGVLAVVAALVIGVSLLTIGALGARARARHRTDRADLVESAAAPRAGGSNSHALLGHGATAPPRVSADQDYEAVVGARRGAGADADARSALDALPGTGPSARFPGAPGATPPPRDQSATPTPPAHPNTRVVSPRSGATKARPGAGDVEDPWAKQ